MCTKWLRKTNLQFSALTKRQGITKLTNKNLPSEIMYVVANNTYLYSPSYEVFEKKFYVLANSDEHRLARPIQK